jgi:hypothetical protein
MLVAATTTTTLVTFCEEDNDDDNDTPTPDPYENLPEEDQPTHCSICKTYRQGPCRPYWRKVELCTKDNELKKDNGDDKPENDDTNTAEADETADEQEQQEEELKDPPCLKYILPWIECASGYRNLYNMIELDTNYTMGIEELEEEAAKSLCWTRDTEPVVEWTEWQTHVQENNWKQQPKKKTTKGTKKPVSQRPALWKILDTSSDPEIITVTAVVPLFEVDNQEGVLECAYAQDQEGNVIGFSYGKSSGSDRKEGEEELPFVTLNIRIIPSHTTHVTVAASYLPPKDEKEQNDKEETAKSTIYKGRKHSLTKVGKKPLGEAKPVAEEKSATEEKPAAAEEEEPVAEEKQAAEEEEKLVAEEKQAAESA